MLLLLLLFGHLHDVCNPLGPLSGAPLPIQSCFFFPVILFEMGSDKSAGYFPLHPALDIPTRDTKYSFIAKKKRLGSYWMFYDVCDYYLLLLSTFQQAHGLRGASCCQYKAASQL